MSFTYDFESGLVPSNWTVPSGSVAGWAITAVDPYQGTYSLKAGTITHSQAARIQVIHPCVAGNISFAYRVSSESGYDYLEFYVDGVRQDRWSGTVAWTTYSVAVTAGSHIFEWRYMKDSSEDAGDDTAWIDQITIPTSDIMELPVISLTLDEQALTTAPIFVAVPTSSLTLEAKTPSPQQHWPIDEVALTLNTESITTVLGKWVPNETLSLTAEPIEYIPTYVWVPSETLSFDTAALTAQLQHPVPRAMLYADAQAPQYDQVESSEPLPASVSELTEVFQGIVGSSLQTTNIPTDTLSGHLQVRVALAENQASFLVLRQDQAESITDTQGSTLLLAPTPIAARPLVLTQPLASDALSGFAQLFVSLEESQLSGLKITTNVAVSLTDEQESTLVLLGDLTGVSALSTETGTSDALGGQLAASGTLQDNQVSALQINAGELAPLADTQGSTLALSGSMTAPLADAQASSDVVSGALAISGTILDDQPTASLINTHDTSALSLSQGSSLVLGDVGGIQTGLLDTIATSDTLSARLGISGTLVDAVVSTWVIGVNDSATLTDEQASSLSLTGSVATTIETFNGISDSLSGRRDLHITLAESIDSALTFDSAFVAPLYSEQGSTLSLASMHGLSGALTIAASSTDTLGGTIEVYAVLDATNAVTDTLSGKLTLVGVLSTVAVAGDTLVAADAHTVYAINADTGAVSEYVLTPAIRSTAFFDDTLFIATAEGLFALDATDDDGTAIEWEARTGFSNLGSDQLKRLIDVNVLGYAEGDVGLTTVHNREGQKVERSYQRIRLTRDAARDGVIKTGRGIISPYWQLGVQGVGSAEIDELRFNIEMTSRRR